MTLIDMPDASELTKLMVNTIAMMVENGELINHSSRPDCIMLDKAEVECLAKGVHILEFYDEFDDELKLREQNLILGRDAGSEKC